jgi:ribulose 1,5-bisphosphate synthetase/thiazole synthase
MLSAGFRNLHRIVAGVSTTQAAALFKFHRTVLVRASTSMASQEYDLVTIGAGSGGVRASRFAAQYYNAKVAVVELPFGFVSSDDIGGGSWAIAEYLKPAQHRIGTL